MAAPAAPVRKRIRLDNDARRAQLLGLARSAFSERSYDEVSIDDLARDAQISKGLLYHYFPTKRDLYLTVLRQIADELIVEVTVVDSDLPPVERIRAGLDALLAHVAKKPRAYVALMRGGIGSDPEVASVVDNIRTRFFERFLADSPFSRMMAGNIRFEVGLRGWIGFVEVSSIDWCANPRLEATELRDMLLEVLVKVLGIVAPKLFGSLS